MTDEFISPEEAKELVKISEENVIFYLKKASEAIRQAATAGKRSVNFYMGSEQEKLAWPVSSWTDKPAPTSLQKILIERIQQKRFGCKFEKTGEPYVPRGLADDDGNGPMHQNWNIVIYW